MTPSDKYIDKCMKILKRFLKENGKYSYMMNYLFGYGRDLKTFYSDVRYIYDKCGMDFGDILHMVKTLGPADKHIDWETNIEEMSQKFEKYFSEHKIKKL